MINLQGALLKAVNIAWGDFNDHIKKYRKSFEELNQIMVIPNVLESFQIDIKEAATQWHIGFAPTEQMSRRFYREFERKHPHMSTNALNSYCLEIVVRKSDFKILKRLISG